MLSLTQGRPIAKVIGGEYDKCIIGVVDEIEKASPCCKKCSRKCKRRPCCGGCQMCYDYEEIDDGNLGKVFNIQDGTIEPLLNTEERTIDYIAGPSGSGKSTIAAKKIATYQKIYPEKDLFIFSRTNRMNDPALKDLKGSQIKIDESIVENPIDIEKELKGGCIVLFDDCNTIQNNKCKQAIDKLMSDIMEVGRKLDITCVITNHLVLPNERKFARTLISEVHSITFFPGSSTVHQIKYPLEKYLGLKKNEVDLILDLPSRWVTVSTRKPRYVIYEKGIFII